jgi:Zn-dependent protease
MGMFGTSWRVGRIAGIEVRIDSSWVVIALLITYSIYLRLSVLYRELSGGGAVGLAVLSAVLFFGSVLVHELAHADTDLTARLPTPSPASTPAAEDAGLGGVAR